MRALSKSKLIAFRQCPKRLWLEVHRPELRVETSDTEARFQAGHEVGEIARRLYDPNGTGTLIDVQAEGFSPALAHSAVAATECSARHSSRRRLAELKSLFELHLLQKQVGHQPSQP